MPPVLSLLDLAVVGRNETVQEGLAGTVALARAAEANGFERVWYAEHHNNPSIASSATSVLIAHVAAHTERIRLGAGGVMLPNHPPLIIAEHYGTLASLHPGRIDLGLGRAPGTDPTTMRALRRDGRAADTFPDDVAELQAYLGEESLLPGVNAYPGKGTQVPLYILGSSLFGAKLAAAMGLPYSFASHFAPAALEAAVAAYRSEFQPSAQLAEPYVIAGVGAIAADTGEQAAEQVLTAQRRRVQLLLPPGRTLTDGEADAVLAAPQGRQVLDMMRYTAVGTKDEVGTYLRDFAEHARADELIIALHADQVEQRVRATEIIAEAI